jgi:N-acetylglutamate synthase-like GNAT family acetyltransferase
MNNAGHNPSRKWAEQIAEKTLKIMHKIITINENNMVDYPQAICFINPKNEYFDLKIDWLMNRFKEGLIIKLLQLPDEKKIAGFIEYIPGENVWRGVKAQDYMFIHCLWIYPNKNKNKGLGSVLVEEVINDAKKQKKAGVAVITSNGSFMAKKDLFIKNDFKIIEEKDSFQLLVNRFNNATMLPTLTNAQDEIKKYKGWHIIYSKQCPWVARFIEEVKPVLKAQNIVIKFHEINNAKEAQKAPSVYSVFNLIKDGKLLADRYISTTRFLNIIKKEGN